MVSLDTSVLSPLNTPVRPSSPYYYSFVFGSDDYYSVIESKPDNPTDDLRVYAPFAELQRHADSIVLEGMDSATHAHVPYLFLLPSFQTHVIIVISLTHY